MVKIIAKSNNIDIVLEVADSKVGATVKRIQNMYALPYMKKIGCKTFTRKAKRHFYMASSGDNLKITFENINI